ncbi:MAG TPA: efflux RND transporter periplasmic adaptor subunit [Candidatus Acidoferrum sp.]|jgi:HlyD family secretion protein|nr:efflux RND transporter periplasmic adaptor subunit [Candidatus Acidoferrum sp.]
MTQTRTSAANHHTRRWIPYAGAVLLVALLVAGLWPKPLPVEIARASIGALRATVNEEGKTRIKQRYVVSAPVAGQLQRIPFKAGAEITAGETVAVIEPVSAALLDARARRTTEAKRDSAFANVEKARTAHTLAASELRRSEKLYSDKTISIQELETVQMRAASTASEEAAAEGALRQAEAELAEFAPGSYPGTNAPSLPREIKAPASGRVLRVFEENSRSVPAGTELLEIGDPADLEVVVEVLSRDGAMIAPGAPVEFDQWGGGDPLLGRVRMVEPAAFTKVSALGVEEQRVNVVADLVTPPEQRRNVGDKFRVDARIIIWEARDALKVPAGSLFRQGDQWATFVVADGRARLRVVKAGRSSGTETQVLDGLKEGEEVILYPGSRVHDGQRVRPIKI